MTAPTQPRLFRSPVWSTEAAALKVGRSKSWVRMALLSGQATASVPVGDSDRSMFSQDDLDQLIHFVASGLTVSTRPRPRT